MGPGRLMKAVWSRSFCVTLLSAVDVSIRLCRILEGFPIRVAVDIPHFGVHHTQAFSAEALSILGAVNDQ